MFVYEREHQCVNDILHNLMPFIASCILYLILSCIAQIPERCCLCIHF